MVSTGASREVTVVFRVTDKLWWVALDNASHLAIVSDRLLLLQRDKHWRSEYCSFATPLSP